MKSICNKIKKNRTLKRISKEHMAEQLNISQPQYHRIESGQAHLTVNRMMDILNVLQIPIEELTGWLSEHNDSRN